VELRPWEKRYRVGSARFELSLVFAAAQRCALNRRTIVIPNINYLAVVAATLSTMIVGSIWYTPKVFGNYWMKKAGVTPSGKASDAVGPIIVTVIVSFITRSTGVHAG
jgi:hypothetical protein